MDERPTETRQSISDGRAATIPKDRGRSGSPKRAFTGFGVLMLAVLAIAVGLVLNTKTVQVSGVSMLPTFHDGQRVLVSHAYWLIGPIQNGDIVVLRDSGPTGYIIKRVYKMAGEVVDWKNQPESYPITSGPFVVPPDSIYVLGDNRDQSEDSRKFGPVKLSEVLGKVVVKP